MVTSLNLPPNYKIENTKTHESEYCKCKMKLKSLLFDLRKY